jgi:uncharacterized membrane protein HdeD (DUF308 family)
LSLHFREHWKGEENMTAETVTDAFKKAAGMSIGCAVVLIVLGFLAVALPHAVGIGVTILVAWAIVLSGFAYLAYAFAAQGAGAFLWRLLIGAVYVAGGLYIAFHSALGLVSLTLVMAAIFFAEGVLQIIVYFEFRSLPGAGWILFDGIVALLLGFLIWRNWPSSSEWAIGTLVGINLMVSGFTLLMYSVAARKALKAIA